MPKKKKKQNPESAPVTTGHDARAEKRSAEKPGKPQSGSDAPDGVSGNWR